VKSSKSFFTVQQSDVVKAARQARRDTRICKYIAIVVGLLGLLARTMTVLAVVKQMKGGKNAQFVAEAGGNSPVTFQEFQMQGTPPENRNAAPSAEGKSQKALLLVGISQHWLLVEVIDLNRTTSKLLSN
jgi:hypothetical protein